jgi:nucleotide-binding universal stress UspA family protein
MHDMKMLLPIDTSEISVRTLETLPSLKEKLDGTLTLLHVFDPEVLSYRGVAELQFKIIEEQARKAAAEFAEEKAEQLRQAGFQATALFMEGSPRKIICSLAESGDYDLLIIGRHTEGEWRDMLFGYVSNYVIHRAKCPVLAL